MTLTRHDICDACHSAAAQVRIAIKDRVLDLCYHHFGVHEAALAVAGAEVLVDQRESLRSDLVAAKKEGVS